VGYSLSESEVEEKEKHVKLEDVAEETGELIGKGIKKTWSVMKSFGKGVGDTLDKREEKVDTTDSPCPHCDSFNPKQSIFCSACGKKL